MLAHISIGASRTIAINIDDDNRLGHGATANVYSITTAEYSKYVAKVYRDVSYFNGAKIDAMLASPPRGVTVSIGGKEYPQYAWPLHVLAIGGIRIGYIMPCVPQDASLALDHFYDPTLVGEADSTSDNSLSFRVNIARNLCALIAELHSHRHFVIDLKPPNIKVFRGTHIVTLLDCDSYSIQALGKKTFGATNYSTDYIAPEALRNMLSPTGLYEYQDRFALAVVLFQLFNHGIHPFQGIATLGADLPSNDDKVREGLYAYGVIAHRDILPCRQSIHQCLDDESRELFDRAFTGTPSRRPSAAEWYDHWCRLVQQKELAACEVKRDDPSHIRFAGKSCGTCHFEGVLESERLRRRVQTPSAHKVANPQQPQNAASTTTATTGKPSVAGTLLVYALLALPFILGTLALMPKGKTPVPKPTPEQHIWQVTSCRVMFRQEHTKLLANGHDSCLCGLPRGTTFRYEDESSVEDPINKITFVRVLARTPTETREGWVGKGGLHSCEVGSSGWLPPAVVDCNLPCEVITECPDLPEATCP